MAEDNIRTVEVGVSWRDVLYLDINDPELKRHVEGFLDQFERSEYKYDFMDQRTRQVTTNWLSGQDMLASMNATLEQYSSIGAFAQIRSAMEASGFDIEIVNGKFTISDHDRPFGPGVRDGSNTMFMDAEGQLPVGVQLGQDYLKGAQYLGVDGRHYPVTVDGVLANELAHLAYRTRDERLSNQVEAIITTPAGAVQRDPSTTIIQFERDSNGGYQTLYDKLPSKQGSLDITLPDAGIRHAEADLDESVPSVSAALPRNVATGGIHLA